jgi:hypothetical protein
MQAGELVRHRFTGKITMVIWACKTGKYYKVMYWPNNQVFKDRDFFLPLTCNNVLGVVK